MKKWSWPNQDTILASA